MPKGLALTINYGQEKALMWALRAEVWVSTCLWRGRSFLFTSSLLLITLETGRVPRRAGETLAPKLWDGGRISRNDLPKQSTTSGATQLGLRSPRPTSL